MSGNSNSVQVSISISDKSVVDTVIDKVNKVPHLPAGARCCIYRVHKKFHAMNEFAYAPEMISVGPLHHGKANLQEHDKLPYVNQHFSRLPDGDTKRSECKIAIREVENEVRECYFGFDEPDKIKFIQMMRDDGIFVDGIVVIEFFHRHSFGQPQRDDIDNWNILARDIILMENQLPMVVLKLLYDKTMTNEPDHEPLSELANKFFSLLITSDKYVLENYSGIEGKHLLDLLRKTFVQCLHEIPRVPNEVWRTAASFKLNHVPVPRVTELCRAGISFKKRSNAGSFLDIKFTKSTGVMEIPSIRIIRETESLLRNLIASEHYCGENSTCMASYAFIMCDLIRSVDDVALLSTRGIIENRLGGGDEIVCTMFNHICREVNLPNLYYSKIYEEVNDFRNSQWRAWTAKMRRNPYNVLSLIVAIISAVFGILAFASSFMEKKKYA